MIRGVQQICSAQKLETQFKLNLKIYNASIKNSKWFSTQVSRRLCQKAETKSEKVVPAVKGIPYKQLTIGVPKEKWQNERR